MDRPKTATECGAEYLNAVQLHEWKNDLRESLEFVIGIMADNGRAFRRQGFIAMADRMDRHERTLRSLLDNVRYTAHIHGNKS